MTEFGALERRAEEALEAYEAELGKLHRDPHQCRERLYRDDEHDARVRALEQQRAREVDAVLEEIRGAREAAGRELAVLQNGDVTAILSPSELTTAASKKVYVEDDLRSTQAEDLAGKLRAVLDSKDRASIFAYVAAVGSVVGGSDKVPQDAARVIEAMRAELAGPERLQRAAELRQTVEASIAAERRVAPGRVGARDAVGSWARRNLRPRGPVR